MICHECKNEILPHRFYGKDDQLETAILIVENSAGQNRQEYCYQCWQAFADSHFVAIKRNGNTFKAITAF